jgi:hypothetical protein
VRIEESACTTYNIDIFCTLAWVKYNFYFNVYIYIYVFLLLQKFRFISTRIFISAIIVILLVLRTSARAYLIDLRLFNNKNSLHVYSTNYKIDNMLLHINRVQGKTCSNKNVTRVKLDHMSLLSLLIDRESMQRATS